MRLSRSDSCLLKIDHFLVHLGEDRNPSQMYLSSREEGVASDFATSLYLLLKKTSLYLSIAHKLSPRDNPIALSFFFSNY